MEVADDDNNGPCVTVNNELYRFITIETHLYDKMPDTQHNGSQV